MEPDIVRPRTLKKQKLQRNPQPERLRMPDELLVRSTIAISFKNSSSVSFRQRAGSPSTSVHLCLPLPFVRFLLGERAWSWADRRHPDGHKSGLACDR